MHTDDLKNLDHVSWIHNEILLIIIIPSVAKNMLS